MRATNTYISPSMVDAAIVYEFCRSGALERSIETVREALAERADTLAQALREQLPDASFVVPDGGYFLWVELPAGIEPGAVLRAAAERGLAVRQGRRLRARRRLGSRAARLLGRHARSEIDDGVKRLGGGVSTRCA